MKKHRVLIVDDQPALAGLVRVALERTGIYEVREEHRPARAFASARTFRPDLIVLDIEMPGKNGAEVARDLWSDAELGRTPIIFLSALVAKREEGLRTTARGPMRFLAKPAVPAQLVEAVRQVLLPEEVGALPAAA